MVAGWFVSRIWRGRASRVSRVAWGWVDWVKN